MAEPTVDLERLAQTRLGLHTVAEHVLAAALYRATGHIGLRATPGGFATPWFDQAGGDRHRRIRVDGLDLVVDDDDAPQRQRLRSVGQAATLAGTPAGAPDQLYTPATPLDPDRPLELDAAVARRLADLYAAADPALADLPTALRSTDSRSDSGSTDSGSAGIVQLWPEHFDLSVTVDEVNYGASPGDAEHAEPYLYVGPWTPPSADGGFWNESFGASRPAPASLTAEQARAFYTEGHRLLVG